MLVFIVFFASYGIIKRMPTWVLWRKYMPSRVFLTISIVIFVNYPDITTTVFTVFDCLKLDNRNGNYPEFRFVCE